jgi:tRNA nucleotidyltransferase (CCA-adding enzyme)
MNDIRNGILRVTDEEKFMEDSLRVYRGIRFAGRFWVAETFLQSRNIRKSVELMFELGILDRYFPYIAELRNIPQDAKWHPEWDVWIHTCMVLEQAQWIAEREGFTDAEKVILYYSALCHDFWKLSHTQVHEDWKITAHWHEEAWVQPTRTFLQQLFFPEETIQKITNLIANHITPSAWYYDAFIRGVPITEGAFRRLSKRLFPASIKELSFLCEADMLGRWEVETYAHTGIQRVFLPGNWIRKKSDELWIGLKPAPSILTGKELLQLGIQPGAHMWEIIRQANYFSDEVWLTKEEIIEKIKMGEW